MNNIFDITKKSGKEKIRNEITIEKIRAGDDIGKFNVYITNIGYFCFTLRELFNIYSEIAFSSVPFRTFLYIKVPYRTKIRTDSTQPARIILEQKIIRIKKTQRILSFFERVFLNNGNPNLKMRKLWMTLL